MANLTINGIKFTVNPDLYSGNYVNSPIVPAETKKIASNKPDIDYMQKLADANEEWNKVVNIIDVDFNSAEVENVDGTVISINNIGQLLKIISDQNKKIKEHNAEVSFKDGELTITF